jgi:small conductance mechanosensitive channel
MEIAMDRIRLESFDSIAALLINYGLSILGALALLIGGWVLSSWAQRATRSALDHAPRVGETVKPILVNLVRYGVLILVLIAVLAQFGVQTASILAIIGAAGLAIGLALQGTLSNVASGVMILFLRPFDVGDQIDAEGTTGTVREIGLFATELITEAGVFVMVPNGQIFNRTVKNFTRLPRQRLDIPIGISYGDDIDKAVSVGLSVLQADKRVLAEPAPQVLVANFGESAVNLILRCWVMSRQRIEMTFEINKALKRRFDSEGITMPYPRRDIRLLPRERYLNHAAQ